MGEKNLNARVVEKCKVHFVENEMGLAGIRRKRGFTIGEVVTVVAIVGTITALAVPNYIRLRTDAQMEMVKQHMRIIAEEFVEIMGKTGTFPSEETWEKMSEQISVTGGLSAGEWKEKGIVDDELSVAISLEAINASHYSIDEYTNQKNAVQFISRPGSENASLGTCFRLDKSLRISDFRCSDGTDVVMNTFSPVDLYQALTSGSGKVVQGALLAWLEYALGGKRNLNSACHSSNYVCPDWAPDNLMNVPISNVFVVPKNMLGLFNDAFMNLFSLLGEKDPRYSIMKREIQPQDINLIDPSKRPDLQGYLYMNSQDNVLIEVGISGQPVLLGRSSSVFNSRDLLTIEREYETYVANWVRDAALKNVVMNDDIWMRTVWGDDYRRMGISEEDVRFIYPTYESRLNSGINVEDVVFNTPWINDIIPKFYIDDLTGESIPISMEEQRNYGLTLLDDAAKRSQPLDHF